MNEKNIYICWDAPKSGAEMILKSIDAIQKENYSIKDVLYLVCRYYLDNEAFIDKQKRNTKDRLDYLKNQLENKNISFKPLIIENEDLDVKDADKLKKIEEVIGKCVFPELRKMNPSFLHIGLTSGTREMHYTWISLSATSKLERQFGKNVKLWHLSDARIDNQDTENKFQILDIPKNPYIEAIELATRENNDIIPIELDLDGEIKKNCLVNKPILLLGERGIGKSTIVETTIYFTKLKQGLIKEEKNKNIQTVICGQLDTNLTDDELFGHVKGAFTGAEKERKGAIELADNGILFLDEIHDLPQATQRKLMRTLQNHTFCRLGDCKELKSNFQLVCASNLSLKELREKLFPDFFDRISTFITHLKPLRDLPEDIIEKLWRNRWEDCHRNKFIIPEKPDDFNLVKETLINSKMYGNIRDIEQLIAYIARDVYEGECNKTQNAKIEAYKAMLKKWSADYNKKYPQSEENKFLSQELLEKEKWAGINKLFRKWLAEQAEEIFGKQETAAEKMGCEPKTLRNAKK